MNYEAVDKYGISLSASTLENSEFVKSLGKSWNQLSDNWFHDLPSDLTYSLFSKVAADKLTPKTSKAS